MIFIRHTSISRNWEGYRPLCVTNQSICGLARLGDSMIYLILCHRLSVVDLEQPQETIVCGEGDRDARVVLVGAEGKE